MCTLARSVLSILLVVSVCASRGSGRDEGAQGPVSAPAVQDIVTIEVVPVEPELNPNEEYPERTFKVGSSARFRIVATNVSAETIAVRIMGPYDEMRPEVYANGHRVKYLERVQKLLESDNNLSYGISISFVQLLPGEAKQIGTLDLSDWYKPLGVGAYELTVKHRLRDSWVQSSPLVFEIRD